MAANTESYRLYSINNCLPLCASPWSGISSERGRLLQSGFGCPTCWTCSWYCRPSCSPSCWCCACLPSWGHDPGGEKPNGYGMSFKLLKTHPVLQSTATTEKTETRSTLHQVSDASMPVSMEMEPNPPRRWPAQRPPSLWPPGPAP